jgi:hypothetical protein
MINSEPRSQGKKQSTLRDETLEILYKCFHELCCQICGPVTACSPGAISQETQERGFSHSTVPYFHRSRIVISLDSTACLVFIPIKKLAFIQIYIYIFIYIGKFLLCIWPKIYKSFLIKIYL